MADGSVNLAVTADGSQAQAEFKKVANAAEDLGNEAEKAGQQTESLGDSASGASGGVEQLGNSGLQGALGMAALVAAATKVASTLNEVAQAAVSAATEFESAFAKTQTIMDTTAMSTDEMREAILQLSQDTGQAAAEISEAVYQAISGSIDTADAVSFVAQANMLAVAGFTSLTSSVDILTTAINAYGMEASQAAGIANVLVQTQNLGKTSVDELSSTLGKAIATAAAYGVSIENVAASYVELTRAGISTAESTTYLSGMLNELGKAGSTVSEILQEVTGQTFAQLMANGATLGDVLQILMDSVNGSSEAFMNLWSSAEAGKAASAIMTQGIEDFNQVVSQMQQEMTGATGTVQAAYEVMASTSEFIDQKFHNAINNLGIAFGSQLTPAINSVKTMLTGIVQDFTELTSSSSLAASAFAGLGVAVTALATGYAIYTAAAAAAKIITESFGTASMVLGGKIMLIVSAIIGLGAAIYTFISNMNEGANSVKQFQEELDGIGDNLSSSLASIEATSNVVEDLIRQLEKLEAAGLDTAEAQAQYHVVLQQLTQVMPELSSLIDLTTDTVQGGTDALREYAAAWKESATAAAYSEYMEGLIRQQANAQLELAEATVNYNNAIAEQDRLLYQISIRQSRINQIEASGQAWGKYAEEYVRLKTEVKDLTDQFDKAEGAAKKYHDAMDTAQQKCDAAADAVEHGNQVVEQAKASLTDVSGTLQDAAAAAADFGSKFGDSGSLFGETASAVSSAVQSIAGDVKDLQTAYQNAYDAAYKSLSGMFQLWEKAPETVATSIEEMTANLQSQLTFFATYKANIEFLLSSGIDGIEQLIAQGGENVEEMASIYAGLVQAIQNGDQAAVEAYMEMLRQRAQLQKEIAGDIAGAAVDIDAECEKIMASAKKMVDGLDISDEAKEAAMNVVQSYIDGIQSGEVDAKNAASVLHKLVLAALSGDASGAGEALGQTFAAGLSGSAAAAARAAQYVKSAAESALHGGNYFKVNPQAYAGGTDYARGGLALVGEEGPELVFLRGGERILSAQETRSALSGLYPAHDLYTSAGGGTSSFSGSADFRAKITVPLNIDGREVARATAEYMGEEMAWEVMG